MTQVIKRSGRRQRLSVSKLRRSIDRAAQEGRVPAAQRRVLVKEISEGVLRRVRRRRSVRSSELRRAVLGRLERRSRAAAAAWRRYDRRKKRR